MLLYVGQHCPVVPDIKNATVVCAVRSFASGKYLCTCVYQYDQGCILSGKSIRKCQPDGIWSGI